MIFEGVEGVEGVQNSVSANKNWEKLGTEGLNFNQSSLNKVALWI